MSLFNNIFRKWSTKKTFTVKGTLYHGFTRITHYQVNVAAKNKEAAESMAIQMLEKESVFQPYETVKADEIRIPS